MAGAIEFNNDDDGYMSWIRKNRNNGFVLNIKGKRSPHIVLHQADCRTIVPPHGGVGPGGLTGKQYIKVCGPDRSSLEKWLREKGWPSQTRGKECGVCFG